MIFSVCNVGSVQIFEVEIGNLLALRIETKGLAEEGLRVDSRLAVWILLEATHNSVQLIQSLAVGRCELVQ